MLDTFTNFADAAEASKGEFQYIYKWQENATRKPRGVRLWCD